MSWDLWFEERDSPAEILRSCRTKKRENKLAPEPNPDPGAGDARHFITLVIVVIIALVLSPLIFQAIKSANSSGNITGTLATIVNLVPLFYYLAVAVLTVADVYLRLRLFKRTTELKISPKRGTLIRWMTNWFYVAFCKGIRPLGA
jgi:hypothetical protein